MVRQTDGVLFTAWRGWQSSAYAIAVRRRSPTPCGFFATLGLSGAPLFVGATHARLRATIAHQHADGSHQPRTLQDVASIAPHFNIIFAEFCLTLAARLS